jgi:hypothetical protein
MTVDRASTLSTSFCAKGNAMQTLYLKSWRETPKRTSKYTGVSLNKRTGRWKAQISHQGIKLILGFFDDERDAALAVNAAQLKYNGQFARLNVIED